MMGMVSEVLVECWWSGVVMRSKEERAARRGTGWLGCDVTRCCGPGRQAAAAESRGVGEEAWVADWLAFSSARCPAFRYSQFQFPTSAFCEKTAVVRPQLQPHP